MNKRFMSLQNRINLRIALRKRLSQLNTLSLDKPEHDVYLSEPYGTNSENVGCCREKDFFCDRLRYSSARLSGSYLADGIGFSYKKLALPGSDWTVSSAESFGIDLKAYI
jgi:hypothetical protein